MRGRLISFWNRRQLPDDQFVDGQLANGELLDSAASNPKASYGDCADR
ncbi:MAG TPA: hypothetical protein VEV85_07680 [Bryobacteraceae bacterium]|nr:hypothetical protein [Bryobacteraceae bacterium]